MSKPEVSIILACYNEGPTFEKNVQKILSSLKKLDKLWEVIFVEDKSTDDTGEKIKQLTGEIDNSQAIYHTNNGGRGKSISDGIRTSRGEICGFLDVDCEISPSYIPIFVSEIEKGADVVVANRFYESSQKAFARFLASKVYAFLVRAILSIPIKDTEAGFKFFRRNKILPVLARTKNKGWFWDTEICARGYFAKLSIVQIPVLFIRRGDKKSTVRILPDTLSYFKDLLVFKFAR